MKGVKKILFTLIIIGLSLTPFFYSIKADLVTIHGAYYATIHQDSNGVYYADITIVTDNEAANGSITIGTLGTYNYRGQLTYINAYRLSGTSWPSAYQSTFTQTINQPAEIVSLDSTQLTSLLNSISAINTTDQNIISALNSIKNEIINNLDNYIDSITWTNIYTGKLQYSTTWDGNLVLGSSQKNFDTDPIYFDFPVTNDLRYNFLYPKYLKEL